MRVLQLLVLVLELGAFHRGQAPQPHVEHRLGLDLAQLEPVHQALLGVGRSGRTADQRDDLVEVVQRHQQALQDVGALAGLAQAVLGAAGDDLALVGEVVLAAPPCSPIVRGAPSTSATKLTLKFERRSVGW